MRRLLGILLVAVVSKLCAATEADSLPRGGVWLVEYLVGADGKPEDIKVIVTADPMLDAKVIAEVSQNWRSLPAFVGRRFRQHFPYVGQWPDGPRRGPKAKYVEVDFVIGAKGVPRDIKLRSPADHTKPPPRTEGSRMVVGDKGTIIEKPEEEAIIAAVAKWRFPEDLNGQHWIHGFFFEPQNERRPNQSLEPTPAAGTSAAEQPLVPAAVVAHL